MSKSNDQSKSLELTIAEAVESYSATHNAYLTLFGETLYQLQEQRFLIVYMLNEIDDSEGFYFSKNKLKRIVQCAEDCSTLTLNVMNAQINMAVGNFDTAEKYTHDITDLANKCLEVFEMYKDTEVGFDEKHALNLAKVSSMVNKCLSLVKTAYNLNMMTVNYDSEKVKNMLDRIKPIIEYSNKMVQELADKNEDLIVIESVTDLTPNIEPDEVLYS